MLDEFRKYLVDEKKREVATAKFYVQDVSQLQKHFADRDIFTLTSEDIQRYVDTISNKMKPRTIRRKVSSLGTFYRWAVQTNQCAVSPISRIKSSASLHSRLNVRVPDVPEKERYCIAKEQLEKMQSAIWSENEFIRLRDQAMFGLMIWCGVRASEVHVLKIGDVNVESNTITIHRVRRVCSGTAKEITVDLAEAAPAVRAYVQARSSLHEQSGSIMPTKHEILFVNKLGTPISLRSIRRKLGEYAAKAGIDINPSKILHSFALQSLKNGISVEDLQLRLGHHSLTTTLDYMHYLPTKAEPAPVISEAAPV